MNAKMLILLTDVEGVYNRHPEDQGAKVKKKKKKLVSLAAASVVSGVSTMMSAGSGSAPTRHRFECCCIFVRDSAHLSVLFEPSDARVRRQWPTTPTQFCVCSVASFGVYTASWLWHVKTNICPQGALFWGMYYALSLAVGAGG